MPTASDAEPDNGGKPASDWFAPRKSPPPGAGEAGSGETTQQFQAPQVAAADVTQPLRLSDLPGGVRGPAGDPPARDLFAGTGVSAGRPPGPTPFGQPVRGAGGPADQGTGGPGPMSGPVPGQDRPFGAPGAGVPFPTYQPPPGPAGPGGPPGPTAPAGPTTGPVTGAMQVPPAGALARSGFRPPTPPAGRVSGDTLVSGIPTVPQAGQRAPEPSAVGGDGHRPDREDKPAKKRRSKIPLLGVGLLFAAGVTYGAGLLMDHADVPKGTTVLGVEIGGASKDEAVKALDIALETRTTTPLTLQVGDKRLKLKPEVAGLTIDTQTTVRNVAHPDYNPVSVIGSLFGQTRVAEPDLTVDRDKLKAALQDLADSTATGSAKEGMVKFAAGKAVGVPGTSYKTLDVAGSVSTVEAAYRLRAANGTDTPVTLVVTNQPPKVTEAEITRAIKDFGDVAMSDLVTVRTDAFHSIAFGPQTSIPKFLTMTADGEGKLQPKFDLAALETLYGSTFAGVLLERGNGTNTAVTPQDVAGALLTALKGRTAADRVGSIENVAP